ncbi:MAG: hypothetical protein LUQ68_08165, partial [Methylococcaceae bacterium]|nr:hypothetical protein [Methylococcaceae bacterium]
TDNLAILVGAVDARTGVIDLDIVARGYAATIKIKKFLITSRNCLQIMAMIISPIRCILI